MAVCGEKVLAAAHLIQGGRGLARPTPPARIVNVRVVDSEQVITACVDRHDGGGHLIVAELGCAVTARSMLRALVPRILPVSVSLKAQSPSSCGVAISG